VGLIKTSPCLFVSLQQLVHRVAQAGLIGAGAIEKGGTLGWLLDFQGLQKEFTFGHGLPPQFEPFAQGSQLVNMSDDLLQPFPSHSHPSAE